MPKCMVCNKDFPDLRKHIKEHGLTSVYYKAKFPGSLLIDETLHESLKMMWRQKAAKALKAKQEKKQGLKPKEKVVTDIQNPTFTGKYLEYYTKIKKQYIDDYKIPEGPELEDLLFFLVSNRQLQELYDEMVSTGSLSAAMESGILKDIRQNNFRIQEFLMTLIDFKSAREKTQDVISLHNETLKKAEEFIKKNYGEFSFRCGSCGQMLDNYGFPHHFFEGDDKYSVFSKELWELVIRKLIPIEYMAFVLHTSVEGILNTAKLREEHLPEINILTAEQALRDLRVGYEA
ncbi:MAG: hypothetical protein WC479_05815 [Candidatus Izemoplasmatales bacterium]